MKDIKITRKDIKKTIKHKLLGISATHVEIAEHMGEKYAWKKTKESMEKAMLEIYDLGCQNKTAAKK